MRLAQGRQRASSKQPLEVALGACHHWLRGVFHSDDIFNALLVDALDECESVMLRLRFDTAEHADGRMLSANPTR